MTTPTMNVPLEIWLITAAVTTAVIVIDLIFQVKRNGNPTFKESAIFTSVFLPVLLGLSSLLNKSGVISMVTSI